VEVVDEDQGRSGSTATHRTGFQRLATEVSLGRGGIVFLLEASRLARNNSDWYRWNKARKGLLRFPLPVGYVQTADLGWALDPDTQVHKRLDYIFVSFRRHGVVRGVVRDLKEQGLELPTRVTTKDGYGSLIWKAPTLSAVIRTLHNPAYAGAYVYGRSEYSSERRSPRTGKASAHIRSVAQWPVNISGHYPGYIR
jgi:Resolvase, N terminal domain/Recombinase